MAKPNTDACGMTSGVMLAKGAPEVADPLVPVPLLEPLVPVPVEPVVPEVLEALVPVLAVALDEPPDPAQAVNTSAIAAS
ncbi:MAG: hypothetical protein JST54_29240 [Deltaproteobacteria bacterium]|nr:hypothetical protein [Deltaproteobacteria bacterium]